MARDHARVGIDIWDDEDWTALTSTQQLAYLTLISSQDLSWCGVLPYIPARFALLSADMTERKFARAMADLEVGRFLIIDRMTAEVLVRSYVRHDGLVKQPNIMKALVRAYGKVHSDTLRDAVTIELRRLYADNPSAKGWAGFAEEDAELFEYVSANPLRKGSGKGSGKGKATPLPPSPFPNTSSSLRSVPREAAHG